MGSRNDRVERLIMPGDYMLYSVTWNNKGPAVASHDHHDAPAGVESVSAETRLCQDGATNPCAGVVKTDSPFGELFHRLGVRMTSGVPTPTCAGGTDALCPGEGRRRGRRPEIDYEHGDPMTTIRRIPIRRTTRPVPEPVAPISAPSTTTRTQPGSTIRLPSTVLSKA